MTCLFEEVFNIIYTVFYKIVSVNNIFVHTGRCIFGTVLELMCYTCIVNLVNITVFNGEILAGNVNFDTVAEACRSAVGVMLHAAADPADLTVGNLEVVDSTCADTV